MNVNILVVSKTQYLYVYEYSKFWEATSSIHYDKVK